MYMNDSFIMFFCPLGPVQFGSIWVLSELGDTIWKKIKMKMTFEKKLKKKETVLEKSSN